MVQFEIHFLFIFSSLVGVSADTPQLINTANIRLEKFYQCPDKMDIPNRLIWTRLTVNSQNEVSIDGNLTVGETVDHPASMTAKMYKCSSKSALDTCEYYCSYTTAKVCEMINEKNAAIDGFLKYTNVPRRCPVKPGNYSIQGAVVTLVNIPSIPFFYGYWKLRSSGMSRGKMWHCIVGEVHFGPPTRKRHPSKQHG